MEKPFSNPQTRSRCEAVPVYIDGSDLLTAGPVEDRRLRHRPVFPVMA